MQQTSKVSFAARVPGISGIGMAGFAPSFSNRSPANQDETKRHPMPRATRDLESWRLPEGQLGLYRGSCQGSQPEVGSRS
jgi:hypothetical protein